MEKISTRHKLVKGLVITSLSITSIFGVNSFFFSLSQNRLSNTIKHFEALDALLTSTTTDQISTISELKRNYLLCKSDFPKACESYFTALIQTRNRAKDYQITFAETLGLSEDDALFDQLSLVYNKTNLVAKKSFDMSFDEAKVQKIRSASEYINVAQGKSYSLANYEKSNKELMRSINILYSDINQWIENDINASKSVPVIMQNVNKAYLILVFAEISLFLLVAWIDIMNNNVSVISEEVNQNVI